MKPRIRKFLAGLLSLGLLLQAASPLSALAAEGSTASEPTLTVTLLRENSDTPYVEKITPSTNNVTLDSQTYEVQYLNGTYTLTGCMGTHYTSHIGDKLTISGPSEGVKPNLVMQKGTNNEVANAFVTVENINDFTSDSIGGSATLTCNGDITITADYYAVDFSLTVKSAHDVTVISKKTTGQFVVGSASINCTGKVILRNEGEGALTHGSSIWINGADGIELYCKNGTRMANGIYIKNCKGDVSIINETGPVGDPTVSNDLTVGGSGDIGVENVTVKANASGPVTKGSIGITAKTLTMQNDSGSIGNVKFTRTDTSSNYSVATGDNESSPSKAKMDGAVYGPESVNAKYLHIGPGTVPPVEPEIPADAEMKLTIGDEVHYLTQNTYSLNLPGSNHVSVTSSPNGYVLMGRLASSGGTGSTPKVTIEGVNGKKLNLELHTQNSPGYLTMGDLEIKNIGNVYVYDWVGGDLTITDVGGVETHPVHGNLTVTNASDVSTGAVYGNMTLTNVSKVTRSYFSNSNGTININAAGEVNIYGISSTGSQISAGATITAAKLVMQFSGLNGSTGTVGPVNFTRKNTTGAYRILTGDSSDAITSQASMSDTIFNKTVHAVYLCIEPGEPEDTSELAITLNGVTAKFGQNAKQAAIGDALITYSATDKAYSISGALTGNVEITGINGKKPNIKMDNSNGSIVSGDLTVTNVTNFTAESSVGSISTGILRVTAAGAVSLTGEFENTIVSAKSLTMRNNHTDPTLGNVIFTAPDGKTYVATTSESDPTQTIEIPTGGPVSGGYLHIAPADTTDTPSDDTPDTSAAISGGDSGAGGALAAVMVGGAAVWGGYQVATRIILHKLLPEGAAIPANRGQLALLVWNAAGRPEPAAAPAFTDVADADTAKAAQWCAEQGYLDVKTESTFKPDGLVTKVKVIEVWNAAFPKN